MHQLFILLIRVKVKSARKHDVLGGEFARYGNRLNVPESARPVTCFRNESSPVLMHWVSIPSALDNFGFLISRPENRFIIGNEYPAAVDILGNLLDTDNDGQVVDDVVKLGTSLLGGLLGGKR